MKTNTSLMRTTISTALSFMLIVPAWSQTQLTYRIKNKDTVGEILEYLGLCPLWGRKGAVAKTVAMNPVLKTKNGNVISPNKTIHLPVASLPENPEYKILNNEVFFTVPNPERKCGSAYLARKKDQTEMRRVSQQTLKTDLPTGVISVPDSEIKKGFESFGRLRATNDFFYSAMDGKDKNSGDEAQILSRVNTASQFAWEQQWDEKNRTFLFYRTEKHSYEAIEDRMPENTYNLQGLGLGLQRKLSDRLDLRFTAGIQERLFLLATAFDSLNFERAMIPELTLSPLYHLYSRGKFNLYADLGLGYLMTSKTSNTNINSGNRYVAGLSLTQIIKDFELVGRTYYCIENQDSSIMKKTSKDLGIGLGVAWSFGK